MTQEQKSTKKPDQAEQTSPAHEILSLLLYIVIVFGICFLIITFVGQRSRVSGSSMEPTLSDGDNLIVDKISYRLHDPERFDIIIFKFPDDESQLFIKRLIGLPGETVEIRDGKVYINGSDEPLDDSFVPEVPTGNYGPYTVPENSYFMLGDNREYSRDSRFWKNTFVSFDEIVGKAIVRYYPSIKLLK